MNDDVCLDDADVVVVADTLGVLGGVQRFVGVLASGLTERGVRVVCVELEGDGSVQGAEGLVVRTLDPGGRRVLPYEPVTGWHRAKLAARGPFAWRALRTRDDVARCLGAALASAPGSTVVLTQLRSAEHAVHGLRGVPRAHRPRLVLQYHGSFEAAGRLGDVARVRRLLPHVDEVLVLNEGDADAFAAALGRRPGVQRNPVDVAGLVAASGPVERPREDRVVVGARLDADKSLDVLVRAWAVVAPRFPTWRLEIHGDGRERGALEALVHDLGLARSVVLPGTTADLPGELRTAALTALSSPYEGMGLVLAEAAACGVPSVTTDAGPGVRDVVVHGETGLVVPVGDHAALGAALASLLGDPARRLGLGRAARDHVARFDTDAVLAEWEGRLGVSTDGRPGHALGRDR